MTNSPAPAPVTERPAVVYKHCFIDVAVKSPSPLMSAMHDLLHLHHAARLLRRNIKARVTYLDAHPGAVRDTTESGKQTAAVSCVNVYRRGPTENEKSDYVDWTFPASNKSIAEFRVIGDLPAAVVNEQLVTDFAELAEIYSACAIYGEIIESSLRAIAEVPAHVSEYRAQSTSGSTGWKFEVTPSRTEAVDYVKFVTNP